MRVKSTPVKRPLVPGHRVLLEYMSMFNTPAETITTARAGFARRRFTVAARGFSAV
jgi:hypothetical protein